MNHRKVSGSRKKKIIAFFQRQLLKLLTRSTENESWIDYADAAPLMRNIIKEFPDDAIAMLDDRLGKVQTTAAGLEDIDAVINFSGHMRDAWVREMAASVPAGARVLDAGAGQCQYKHLFAHTHYEAQDFAQYGGTDQGPLAETWSYPSLDYVCDITSIPVDDCSFDAVILTEVLEHVPDPISAIRELCRVTRPGGRLFISAPLTGGIHQEPYHFYGGFSPYFYKHYLEAFDCEIVQIQPLGGLLKHIAQEVHRVGRTIEGAGDPLTPEHHHVLMQWLPRLLSRLDEKYFIEQFTVGYLVEARKKARQ